MLYPILTRIDASLDLLDSELAIDCGDVNAKFKQEFFTIKVISVNADVESLSRIARTLFQIDTRHINGSVELSTLNSFWLLDRKPCPFLGDYGASLLDYKRILLIV